jgi:hypothetical protein
LDSNKEEARLEKLHNEKIQNLHQINNQETCVECSIDRRVTKCRRALVGKSERNRNLEKDGQKLFTFAMRPAI